ncbi:MAG: hypothetical protein E3J94_02790 [Desulfobacteraceae bacterium]|nr:MAG: hypothetical protein E3J94_02790 [Desulfobacteraceae bacterium]
MNYRIAKILPRLAVSSDYTEVIDITLADPVSQFEICYESTAVGSGSPDHHAARCVSKIELIDGSDVLFSLTGQEAQAVDFYHNRSEPANDGKYQVGANASMVFNLNFGRFLFDPLFAFDPKKFNNPQLKVTIDRGAGGVQSVAGFITIIAKIFDGKAVAPEGFLMHKEIKNYGLGSASHEYTDMPTDFPFRKMFIAAQTENVEITALIDTLKLSEDNDRKIPFDITVAELLRSIVGQCPPYREHLLLAAGGSGSTFYTTPCHHVRIAGSTWEVENNPYTMTLFSGDGGKATLYGESTITNFIASVEGYAPHGAMEIPFGLQDDPDDWYDVAALGSLRLDILSKSGRSSSDTVQVFLQQLRRYAA